jgi:hypothetical protein
MSKDSSSEPLGCNPFPSAEEAEALKRPLFSFRSLFGRRPKESGAERSASGGGFADPLEQRDFSRNLELRKARMGAGLVPPFDDFDGGKPRRSR